jgi:hypothetical protein
LSRESTHAKEEFTTCRVVQEQKKRPLSWVDLELPFRLHMTNKYLAIPNIFPFQIVTASMNLMN